jgi:hypothetical protein
MHAIWLAGIPTCKTATAECPMTIMQQLCDLKLKTIVGFISLVVSLINYLLT